MKFYKTRKNNYGGQLIEAVETERETDQCVWIKGRRVFKFSEWEQFWPTWQDAHAHLLKRAEFRVNAARRELEQANGELGNIKGMKEPA